MTGRNPTPLRRRSEHMLDVPRSLGRSHGFTQEDQYREAVTAATGPLDRAAKFLKLRVWEWIWHYLKTRLGGKYPLPAYAGGIDTGVHPLGDDVSVSVAGDWATGTEEAHRIAELIRAGQPDFTIHLGDIYYVGTKREVYENLLGGQVEWPKGRRGSFALNGNHEMYARGKAYFVHLLPQLGMRGASGEYRGQVTSYFALENAHWLVIGLDTGYHSVGLPILEKIFKPSARLPAALVEWLRDVVHLQDDRSRGVVLLSHHQYYSAFERGHDAPARQLEAFVRRPVLWLWGHEHRFALYGKARGARAALEAWGRCLGHGAMPVEDIRDQPDERRAERHRLALFDRREKRRTEETGTPIGYNGYADLRFRGRELSIEHRDIDGQLLVRERWQVDEGGMLRGMAIERLVDDPDLVVRGALSQAVT